MPIRINEILVKDKAKENELIENIFKLITTNEGGKYYSGSFNQKDKKLFLISYDLNDEKSNERVMRCIFTMQERNNANEIIDIDITIPNVNLLEVDFINKESDQDDSEVSEAWTIEYDSKRALVETVNKHVINKELLGINTVSLSAMPYEGVVIAKDIDKLNELLGFKPKVYKWQKELGMGEEPISLGFAPDFTSSGMIIGEILSHKNINVRIFNTYYEGIVVEIKTGLGKLPALLPIEFADKVVDGYYIRMLAELKADFAVGDYSYYK